MGLWESSLHSLNLRIPISSVCNYSLSCHWGPKPDETEEKHLAQSLIHKAMWVSSSVK